MTGETGVLCVAAEMRPDFFTIWPGLGRLPVVVNACRRYVDAACGRLLWGEVEVRGRVTMRRRR